MGRAEPKGVSILSHTVPLKLLLLNFSPIGKITLLLRLFALMPVSFIALSFSLILPDKGHQQFLFSQGQN